MPQVRCPQCGAVNDTRALDYPFCSGCQDNLAKCGYCQWFDGRVEVCGNPAAAGEFEVSREATPPCAYHSPRLELRVKRGGRVGLVAVIGLAAAMFALGYGLFRLMQAPRPAAAPPASLKLAVEADYRGTTLVQLYRVTAEITNDSETPASGLRLGIGREFLKHFELVSVEPRPTRASGAGEWHLLFYPKLHPGERRTITMDFAPKETGTFNLRVQVTSSGNPGHGAVGLPVRVKQ